VKAADPTLTGKAEKLRLVRSYRAYKPLMLGIIRTASCRREDDPHLSWVSRHNDFAGNEPDDLWQDD
jgi:hypothetical protein